MSETLLIHEIYASIQGESTWAGLPCTFVRTSACNLRCRWCDTPQAFYGGARMPRADVLSRALGMGTPLVELASCDSTNREALQRGRAGAVEGTVVIAAAQTAGRGRRGRTWHSPAGENLYLSVILRPPCPPSEAPLLTLVAGVALCEAAEQLLAGAPQPTIARLKWPNDLLLGAPGAPLRKAGGILTELVCAAGRIDFVVVGIGLRRLHDHGGRRQLGDRRIGYRPVVGQQYRRDDPVGG